MQAVEQPERIVVAPNGDSAAFVVLKRSDGRQSDAPGIWYGPLEGVPSRVSQRIPDTPPAFSPDGAELAFGVQEAEGSRLTILRLDDPDAEPRSLPLPGYVERLSWSTTGLLALAAEPGADSASLTSGRPLPGADADPRIVGGNLGWRRLWLIDPGDGTVRAVTAQGPTIWEFAPQPGGGVVALCSDDPSEDGWYHPYLAQLTLDPAAMPRVIHRSAWQLASPTVDPSGEHVAFVEGWASDRGLLAGEARVIRLSTSDSDRQAEPETLETGSDVTWLSWEADGRLWFAGWDHLGTAWGWTDPRQGAAPTVNHEAAGCINSRWHPSIAPLCAGSALTSRSTADSPPEVFRLESGGTGAPWTTLNAGTAKRPFELRELRWTGAGGLEIEGLLALPSIAQDGPLPLVVDIHGGPSIAWHHSWGLMWAEVLSEAGFAVLMPNPRGGVGRGQPFARLNHGDPAGAELEDVIAGVQHCTEQGLADPARVGAIGASYGGYMTAWSVSRPDVFAAGVVIAGVTDLLSCRGTANNSTFYDFLLAGSPQTAGALYLERSPVVAVSEDTAPTLMLHGEQDRCVPVGQAHELHFALHAAGVPNKLVIYPREGHQTMEPAHVEDQHQRAVDWFNNHLVAR